MHMMTKLVLLFSVIVFAMAVTSAVFAGDDMAAATAKSQNDRLAAKAMSDDELDQVNAGIQAPVMMMPFRAFNFINIGGQVKVATTPVITKVYVKPSIHIRTFRSPQF